MSVVTVGNSAAVRGWGSVFLKAFLLSSLLGCHYSFSAKKGMTQQWDDIFLLSGLGIWVLPGGTAILLQAEGAEDPRCVWPLHDITCAL